MKFIALNVARGQVPRPTLKTPEKGTVGDLCHEEQAEETSIKRIMNRYAGRLEEMLAWRTKPLDFADCSASVDRQECIERVRNIDATIAQLASELNISRDDVKKLVDGDLSVVKGEKPHEENSNESQEKPQDISQNGESSASEK